MENVKNTTRENYGKCFHSSIYVSENVEFIYTKAYKGDWGDWDEQPETKIPDPKQYDQTATSCTPVH